MTVIGDNFDAISAGTKLKRLCDTRLESFGPIKEHEGEHHKAEADKANKRKKDKLPFTILSRMCISDKQMYIFQINYVEDTSRGR